MRTDNHSFCRCILRTARLDAKSCGVSVSKLRVWLTGPAHKRYAEVRDARGILVWQGRACCAFEARAMALGWLADAADKQITATPRQFERLKIRTENAPTDWVSGIIWSVDCGFFEPVTCLAVEPVLGKILEWRYER